jgi:phenylacetate-CoA ligase
MYPSFYQALRLLLPGGIRTRKRLRELERMQWWSRSDLELWQLMRIQQLVEYAYAHVPFYRHRYQTEDIHPADIKSLDDFENLPFLTREDVKNNLDALISPDWRGKLYLSETGGSTGTPIHFFVEDSFWRWNIALEARGRRWYNVQVGDKMAWVWGAPRDMPEWSWRKRLIAGIRRQRYLNAFMMSDSRMQAFAEMLVDWQPAIIRAYPSALSLFAKFIKERGITGIRPKAIETSAEKVTEVQRQLLEDVFQCPVVDCYGSRELGAIAWECKEGNRHLSETHYIEIDAGGKKAQPGQMGEVVVTSLIQYAMPFIRYKNDDIAVLGGDNCTCGRGLHILQEVVGRTHDYLITDDGQFVHGLFFAYIFRVKPEVVRYQIYQPDRKNLEVRVVCRQEIDSAWIEQVKGEIQARFGDSVNVLLQIVDRIELTPAGKHRYIISDIAPDFS